MYKDAEHIGKSSRWDGSCQIWFTCLLEDCRPTLCDWVGQINVHNLDILNPRSIPRTHSLHTQVPYQLATLYHLVKRVTVPGFYFSSNSSFLATSVFKSPIKGFTELVRVSFPGAVIDAGNTLLLRSRVIGINSSNSMWHDLQSLNGWHASSG